MQEITWFSRNESSCTPERAQGAAAPLINSQEVLDLQLLLNSLLLEMFRKLSILLKICKLILKFHFSYKIMLQPDELVVHYNVKE